MHPDTVSHVKRRLQLAGSIAAMVVTAVNIPLGAPLAGLWVASRVAGGEPITMAAVFAFVIVAAALAFGLTAVLGYLGAWHDALAGRKTRVRSHLPWLRSMSGERVAYQGDAQRLGALDFVLIAVVVATLLAFEIWFAFFSGSPFDQRTGRG